MRSITLLVGFGAFTLAGGTFAGCPEDPATGSKDTTTGDLVGAPDVGGADAMLDVTTPDAPVPDTPSGDPGAGVDDPGVSGDTTELPISMLAAAACAEACDEIAAGCPDLSAVGGSENGCLSACLTAVEEVPQWLANYLCMAISCDAALCFPNDSPLPQPTACGAGCTTLAACDLFYAVGARAEEAPICPMLCSGVHKASPEYAPIIDCMGYAPSDDCAAAESAILACHAPTEGPFCASVCADFYDAAIGDHYCPPTSELATVWPDEAACNTACLAVPPEKLVAWTYCVILRGCQDPSGCADVPTIPPEGCAEPCVAFEDFAKSKCDEEPNGGMNTAVYCVSACSALLDALGVDAPNPDAAECIQQAQSCEGGELIACLATPPPDCVEYCGKIAACIPTGMEFSEEECLQGCAWGTLQDPQLTAEVIACVDAAGENCLAIFDCIPESGQ